jgi:hypothetical protein
VSDLVGTGSLVGQLGLQIKVTSGGVTAASDIYCIKLKFKWHLESYTKETTTTRTL